MVKNIILSLVIAVAAYLILALIQGGNFLPGSVSDYLTLLTLLIAAFAAAVLGGTSGSPTGRTSSARSGGAQSSGGGAETGTVKWFNVKKGYGFITRDQGDDVFVHYRNIVGKGRRAIDEGQRVRFNVVDGDKGLQADEVEPL